MSRVSLRSASICRVLKILVFCSPVAAFYVENGNHNHISYDFPPQEIAKTPESDRKLTMMFSSWRSGSTFVADLVSSPKGTFYFYEPLEFYHSHRFEMSEMEYLSRFHSCDFTGTLTKLWHMNEDLQDIRPSYIYAPTPDIEAVGRNCWNKPLQVMKVLRKNSEFMEEVLEAVTDVEVRGFYLVRDPRATWNSRKGHDWCQHDPACIEPWQMCVNMTRNYYQAQQLMAKYPDKFTVVRFEDISRDIWHETEKLFQFLGLPYEQATWDFVSSHTSQPRDSSSFSTFRETVKIPVHWLHELSFRDVEIIQNVCGEAMSLWGYKMLDNPQQMYGDFDPILSYSI